MANVRVAAGAVDDVGLIYLTHKIAVAECGGTQPKRLKSVEYILLGTLVTNIFHRILYWF